MHERIPSPDKQRRSKELSTQYCAQLVVHYLVRRVFGQHDDDAPAGANVRQGELLYHVRGG